MISYKEWWTNAAKDYDSARSNVYETQDEEDFKKRGWEGDAQSYGAKRLIEIGKLDAQSTVLEIGCGLARIGREMAPYVKEWVGVDISPSMINFAKTRTSHLNNVKFHELETIGLGIFRDNRFDFVYSTVVFMHLDKEDMFQYLKGAFRVLKPDRIAYFDTWNLLNDNIFEHFLQTQKYNLGDKKVRNRNQYSTPQEMRKYLEKIGFQVIDILEEELLKCVVMKPNSLSFT